MSETDIYTPEILAKEKKEIKFKIPLYQRLFTWDKGKIEVLLEDLYYHFKNSRDNHGEKRPYYLGIITQIKENNTDYHLVIDGQQRLTVLMLMAAVFAGKDFLSENWQSFLFPANQNVELESVHDSNAHDNNWKLRLLPFARNDDKNSLKTLIIEKQLHSGKIEIREMVTNKLMLEGIEAIFDFMNAPFTNDDEKKEFINDIYKHLTLLVTTLDASYLKRPEYLNKYFENMNSNYKNLENHEKLKIWLVSGHKGKDKDRLLEIWNKCEDLSTPLYQPVKNDNDTDDEIREMDFIAYWKNVMLSSGKSDPGKTDEKPLWDIDAKPSPQNSFVDKGSRSIITFPQFLLLALDIFIDKYGAKTNEDNQQDSQMQEDEKALQEKEEKKRQFYNTSALLNTFGDRSVSKIEPTDIPKFYDLMRKLRALLDFYVIRRVEDDEDSYSVMCGGKKDKATQEVGWTPKKSECRLAQYQAMLDVAFPETFYKWLKPYLSYLYDAHFKKDEQGQICPANDITPTYLLEWLKKWDDQRLLGTAVAENKIIEKLDKILAQSELKYDSRNRYWFWRLDYYLWENCANPEFAQKFLINNDLNKTNKTKQMEAIKAYRMRANRSIEHLYPQNTNPPWSDDDLNCFGNLAMISSSFNSVQSNNPIPVKFSRLIDQVERGKLQSLKLLAMRGKGNGSEWDEKMAKTHEDEMIAILKESFGPIAASSQYGSQGQIIAPSQNGSDQQI